MSKHTPGPWAYNASSGYVYDSADATVCDAYESFDKEQSDINGRLIAAAPELLEALQRLMPHANSMLSCVSPQDDALAFSDVERARAAIAKATGEQS